MLSYVETDKLSWKPEVLQYMESQRVGYDLVAEPQQQSDNYISKYMIYQYMVTIYIIVYTINETWETLRIHCKDMFTVLFCLEN